jgi:hypothetical protein
MTTTVIGLFKETREADQAIEGLTKRGFDRSQISVMARKQDVAEMAEEPQKIAGDDDVTFGALAGATGGATLGIFAGMLIGLSAITLPGVGPVFSIGALATVLGSAALGTGLGAAAGGLLLGALARMGLPEKDAHVYAEGVKRGGILVAVEAENERAIEAETTMREANAADIDKLRATWEQEGWSGFEEAREPDKAYSKL